jgi:peptide/nickel transport system substrate-binding protein
MLKKYLFLLCLLSLMACHQQDANVAREDIRFGIAQAPINLDPRYATDAASARVNRLLYRALVRFDEHYQVQPDLASWQIISPTQYRFSLGKAGRIFHDGAQLDAPDVQATYQSLLDLKDSPLSAEFSNIKQIKLLDKNTHWTFI